MFLDRVIDFSGFKSNVWVVGRFQNGKNFAQRTPKSDEIKSGIKTKENSTFAPNTPLVTVCNF